MTIGVITRNAYASSYSDGYECRETSFTITVTYPYEVYEAGRAEITLYGYNTGYSNEYIETPITSSTVSTYIQLEWGTGGISVRPGTYRSYDQQYVISKKIGYSVYNGADEDEIEQDTYPVRWNVSSNYAATDGYILKEDPDYGIDSFYSSSDQSITKMETDDGTVLTSNVGIYFVGSTALLRRRWMD